MYWRAIRDLLDICKGGEINSFSTAASRNDIISVWAKAFEGLSEGSMHTCKSSFSVAM